MAFLDCFNRHVNPELNTLPRIGFARTVVRMSDGLKDFLKNMVPPGFVQWRKKADTPFIVPVGNTPIRLRLDLLQLEDRANPAVNPIVAENLLPGTPQSQWDIVGSGDPALQGFATEMSVNRGETVNFKINNLNLSPYRVDVYRMGYYGGLGARLMGTISSANTQRVSQPAPLVDEAHGLVDAGNWSVTASWQVPANAVSGIYFARITREDTGGASHIVFIVRDDDSRSDVLFQTSDTTWQAYNNWGGNSLYGGSSAGGMATCGCGFFPGSNRAYAVSYNRPYTTRTNTYNGRDFVWGAEYPMVRWLEANGYNVSYFSGVDTARRGNELLEHKTFMTVGHDEYWSGAQRANVEAARDAGVNMMFLAGNDVYWRTRWMPSIDATQTDYRTMLVYKETFSGGDITPDTEWTGTWRDPRFTPPNVGGGQPENALTGTIFTVNRGPGGETGTAFTVSSEFANLRAWRNTAVANLTGNQVLSLGDRVLGYEWNEDLDNGFRPAGLFRLSETTQNVPEKILDYGATVGPGTATHSLTLYRARSGALVFSAGTVQWSWGLDGTHDGGPTLVDNNMRQFTINVLADMGVQPDTLQAGLVRGIMSTDIVGPSVAITSPTNGSSFTAGVPVTITGTASDTGGGVIGSVEVSTDGGRTWHRATGRGNWTYTWIPTQSGPISILARASDDSANLGLVVSRSVTVTFTTTPTTNLVAAYSFNSGSGTTLVDTSGRGNNGVISNATWTTGKYGSGLSFNGSNSWVTIPDANSLDLTTGMTISAWVRASSLSDYSTIVIKETTGGQVYSLYAADGSGAPPSAYARVGTSDNPAVGTSPLALNTWVYVSATFDGTTLTVYVNGQSVASEAVSGSLVSSTGVLRIGGNSIWGEYFNGVIDEVRIYNRALSPAELLADLSTPIGGTLDTSPPTGSISAPGNGSSVSGNVSVTVTATDNALVAGVQLLLNGVPLGTELTAAPFTYVWDSTKYANGSYTLTARIRDVAGNAVTTAAVTVTVANSADVTTPIVTLRGLGDGVRVSGSTLLWAAASDNIQVVGVQFKINGTNYGAEVTTAPYRAIWNTTTWADGTYTITAVARDAAGNTRTSAAWTLVVDNTLAAIVNRTPASGATGIDVRSPLSLTFSEAIDAVSTSVVLRDPSNNFVPGVGVYNPATFVYTFTPSLDLNLNTTYSVTVSTRDVAGNLTTATGWTFTTAAAVTNVTIFDAADTPAVQSVVDTAIEVGVRFQTLMDGFITGVRFYKGSGNTGTHVGSLWSAAGTLLASVTFTNESASGWQQADFDTPVAVTANTTYVISYFAPNGGYAATAGAFATAGAGSGALRALSGPAAGGNGVYRYTATPGFPSAAFNNTNYWVDALFSSSLVDATPPTVIARTPASGATSVPQSTTVIVQFSESVTQSSISLVVRNPSNDVVPGSWSYNDVTHVVTFTPTSNLLPNAVYSVTVSGAVDAAGNVMSPVTWSFTTSAPDTTPPTVATNSPANGATGIALRAVVAATFSEPVQSATVTFALRDAGNNLVSGTGRYDEATRTFRFTPAADLTSSTVYTATLSGTRDTAGNQMTTASWSFTTSALITNASLWNSNLNPDVAASSDTAAVEVGMKFQVSQDGYLSGVRFYKGAGNTGTHLGHLWDSNGTLLGTVTFASESASGWQQAAFASPVAVDAGRTYVVSYYAPNGRYSYTLDYFTANVTQGPITALASGTSGGNGVYRYVAGGGFPNQNFGSPNYFVDVIYTNSRSDITPAFLTSRTPAPGATDVIPSTTVTATFSEDIQLATLSFVLKDVNNNVIPSNVTYNAVTRTATLAPNSPLPTGATFTATVSGVRDLAGNLTATTSWSFTTITNAPVETLWDLSATPAVASANDFDAVELGLKFQTSVSGFVTGIRFYKGAGNNGTHVGNLWSATGTLLASGTFQGESTSGWQTLVFDAPVAISAGTTYVASYFAPVGRYSYSGQYFGSSMTSGSITALSNGGSGGNGLYRYTGSSAFPNQSFNATNYWVDVTFTTSLGDSTPPTIVSRTPASGATGVDPALPVTVTFSESVQAGTIVFEVRDPSNNLVPGSVSYNATTKVATFTPTNPLAQQVTFTVTVSGARDVAGNQMTSASWSFTTRRSWVQTTAADFTPGTASGVQVTADGGGRIALPPTFRDDFPGTSLSGNWTTSNWSGSGSTTVAGGEATVAAAQLSTTASYTGKPAEGRVKFGSVAFQHFGLATSFDSVAGNSWAIFSTGSSATTLYARVNANGTTSEVTIGDLPTSYTLYRIEPTASNVKFYIDGTLVATVNLVVNATPMKLTASAYLGSSPMQLDWASVADVTSGGTYTSVSYDTGITSTLLTANWTAGTPGGTSLIVEVASSADGTTWSGWTTVTNGVAPPTTVSGRYFRYRVTFATTDVFVTPTLDDVTLLFV